MKTIKYIGAIALICSSVFADSGDMEISRMAGPWPIKIKTCAHDAGAICSLTWRNKEFIDDFDHGRQLQSASSFDYLGEGFNPTEAGASHLTNGYNPSPSSSVLQGYWSKSNQLATQTKMAYWNPVNGEKTSNHIFNKKVTIGAKGLAHVIEYRTQFTLPSNEVHSHGVFEALTGYMPTEFSKFWTFDVNNGLLNPLSKTSGEQSLPIIFSTVDGGWAMGIYSPGSPQNQYPTLGYGRWSFSDVVKWNNVYRINNPKGTYHFLSYVIVGSLENVTTSMMQLHNTFK